MMSELITTLIRANREIDKTLAESIVIRLIKCDFFIPPLYFIPEVILPPASFKCKEHLVPGNEIIDDLTFFEMPGHDSLIYSSGINKNPSNIDLFYDLNSQRQQCDIGIYHMANVTKLKKQLMLRFFSPGINEVTNFFIILNGKTAPCTEMLRDSLLYKELMKYCAFDIYERNL
jgi:hypothetical protein